MEDFDNILPTLYQFYTSNGITSGLNDTHPSFQLNGKKIRIFSGALHYFRVHPGLWKDRLRKLRAAGLNCVETYVPWNLHEPQDGQFDFGNSQESNDLSFLIDIKLFLKMAQEEDLFVILRPGPYICAEWEFGGLPSWLLRKKDLKIRTSDPKFIFHVERYFKELLDLVAPHQFTKGGSIIAVQIENEYGNVKEDDQKVDTDYLEALKDILRKYGIVELLFTSDTPSAGFQGTIPGILATANFQEDPSIELALLKTHQPDQPLMVMEYWTGWFDHYTENHHERNVGKFDAVLEDILSWNASFNLYMMHGGTNWGFMNGGNIFGNKNDNSGFQPDTSSYDYDAPLSENGDYTDKYLALQRLTAEHNDALISQPSAPDVSFRTAYPDIEITEELSLNDSILQTNGIKSEHVISMEQLDINHGSGQSYGYIVYRKVNIDIEANSTLLIEGHVCDTVQVLINGKLVSNVFEHLEDLNGFGYWRKKDSSLHLGDQSYVGATLDLIVENFGRVNYGKLSQFNQFKGLWQGNVLINENIVKDWLIYPLEFKKSWMSKLTNWKPPTFERGPRLYKAILDIPGPEILDSYIDFKGWNKGFVVVNGFVLSRFFKVGPQQAGYLPAPFLKRGLNEIFIFEHFVPNSTITFCTDPYFDTMGDGKILRTPLE